MAEKELYVRIQNKYDSTDNWDAATFIPYEGELLIYKAEPPTYPLPRIKFGDGINIPKDLPFVGGTSSDGDGGGTEQPELIKVSYPIASDTEFSYNGEIQYPNWENLDTSTVSMVYYSADNGTNISSVSDITSKTVGTYKIEFTPKEGYTWENSSTDTYTVTWTIKAIATLLYPTITTNEFVYSYNTVQTPDWPDWVYNSDIVETDGNLYGSDVGDYTVTFTPKEGYVWAETNNREPYSVDWQIVPAELSITSISGSTLILNVSFDTNTNQYLYLESNAIIIYYKYTGSNATVDCIVSNNDVSVTHTQPGDNGTGEVILKGTENLYKNGSSSFTFEITLSAPSDLGITTTDSQIISVEVRDELGRGEVT